MIAFPGNLKRADFCVWEDETASVFVCTKCGHRAKRPLPGMFRLCDARSGVVEKVSSGVGDSLKDILAYWGYFETLSCPCKSHVMQLNARTLEQCKAMTATIAGWLREGAVGRGEQWTDEGLLLIVDEAIRRAEAACATS
jgi:hypothetical protein